MLCCLIQQQVHRNLIDVYFSSKKHTSNDSGLRTIKCHTFRVRIFVDAVHSTNHTCSNSNSSLISPPVPNKQLTFELNSCTASKN
mmetsp:Transcript_22979/g.34866  ORF Transcript_22979/g.34866 Transcript_22979/m.34866 type:complete len:85 (+) Transcript_22979:23-277(+)